MADDPTIGGAVAPGAPRNGSSRGVTGAAAPPPPASTPIYDAVVDELGDPFDNNTEEDARG